MCLHQCRRAARAKMAAVVQRLATGRLLAALNAWREFAVHSRQHSQLLQVVPSQQRPSLGLLLEPIA